MPAISPALKQANAATIQAAKTVECVVGNGWATDAAGTFIYMTPDVLARLDVTLEDLNSRSEGNLLGWQRIVHPDDYPAALARWLHCLEAGEYFDVEHRLLRSSGAYIWTRSSGQPLCDDRGKVVGWYGTFIDGDVPVAARERFAAAASERIPIPPEFDIRQSLSRTHPQDRTSAAHAAARAFWTGVPQVTRHRQLQEGGDYRWTETRAEPSYSVSIDIDDVVTDREPPDGTATSLLGETDADPFRCVRTIECLFGNGWAFDPEGRWIYLHPFAQSSLGVSLDDLNASLSEGHTAWKRLLHPDDYDQVATIWRHCLDTGDDFNVEFRFRRVSGAYVWARTSARPTRDAAGRITGWYGIALDIDVYKKTVAALRDRERELSQLVDLVPGHLWRLTPVGAPAYFNKRMRDYFSLGDLDITNPSNDWLEAVFDAAHPDDETQFRTILEASLVTGDPFSMRHRLRRHDGVYRWMSTRGEPLHDQNGRIVQWYGVCHDIDDQMQAEETLRQSEGELRALVDALPINILSFDPAGRFAYASRRYLEQVGAPMPHIDHFDALAEDLVHPEDFPVMFRRATNGLTTGRPFVSRFRQRDRQGIYRWIEARAQPLRDENDAIIRWYMISIDIEDEIRAQEELRIAQQNLARQSQAASLAELSASIAHEVNQPLAAIAANSHACQRWLAAEPPNFERAKVTVERIIRDAKSAADVVGRIRALFKRTPDTRAVLEIGEFITQACDLLAEEATRRQVRLRVEIEDGLPPIALDGVQIQQVLVNLVRNGIEAMEEALSDDRVLQIHAFRRESALQVEVRDRGPGIEASARIFEPFFSTKAQGMGMGLAICRSIVESHGGRLWAEGNNPQGAALIFTLPLQREAVD